MSLGKQIEIGDNGYVVTITLDEYELLLTYKALCETQVSIPVEEYKRLLEIESLYASYVPREVYEKYIEVYGEIKGLKPNCQHEWVMTGDSFDQTCYCKKCNKSN